MRILHGRLIPFISLLLAAQCLLAVEKISVLPRNSEEWVELSARTLEDYPGFGDNPATDQFGGWEVADLGASGFFRIGEWNGRKWFVTPEGHPFISVAVAGARMGTGPGQREAFKSKYTGPEAWLDGTVELLSANGFNSVGCWSDHRYFKGRFPYALFVRGVRSFVSKHKIKLKDGKLTPAVVEQVVSDPAYPEWLEGRIAAIASEIGDDPYCMGWFIDNELTWDYRKPSVFRKYLEITHGALRKYDKNHLYLGCRFNNWRGELSSREYFAIAGQYMDVISVNHYGYWKPDFRQFDRWGRWSGRPVMVTEFYAKAEDSGLGNTTGAGWTVQTQRERGVFYQNFVLSLLQSSSCVGWQWFRYQDNDPLNTKADPSNRDSNKGIVGNGYEPYEPMLAVMKELNSKVFALADSLHRRKVCGRVIDSETGLGISGVAVSDGFSVTTTDADGRYVLPDDGEKHLIQYSTPAGYRIEIDPKSGLPKYWGGPDFVLTKETKRGNDFDLIAIGDPQARSEKQWNRYLNETIADIQSFAPAGSIALALGDIVSDSDATWEPMARIAGNVHTSDGEHMPYFNTVGNHDSNRYENRDSCMVRYIKTYGPLDYSFNIGNVHFVVMDDIMRTTPKQNKSVNGQTWQYDRGFSVEQLRWLQDDLDCVEDKENKVLIFAAHIPFMSGKGELHSITDKNRRAQVLREMKVFKEAHILSAHFHHINNYIHKGYVCKGGQPIYEHNCPAAGGGVPWWKPAKDGTPNGYCVFSFRDGRVDNWFFKGTGMDPSEQMRVLPGTVLAQPDPNAIVVELWNDDNENWKVEYLVKGKVKGEFKGEFKSYKKGGRHRWIYAPGKSLAKKNWEVRATQVIPGSGRVNVYRKNEFDQLDNGK